MNPRALKEFRVVAPYWAAQLAALALVPFLSPPQNDTWWVLLVLPVIYFTAQLIACGPFASELHDKTMHRLLSEPIDRRSLWWNKLLLPAVLLCISTLFAAMVCFFDSPPSDADWRRSIFNTMSVSAIIALGAGLYMSVIIPQPFSAFLAACIAPFSFAMIGGIIIGVIEHYTQYSFAPGNTNEDRLIYIGAVMFSALCLVLSYRHFRRMELA